MLGFLALLFQAWSLLWAAHWSSSWVGSSCYETEGQLPAQSCPCKALLSNDTSLLWLKFGFAHGNLLQVFVVHLDGLQLSTQYQPMGKGVFPGLQNFVTKRVFDASQEELMLKERGHVAHFFQFSMVWGGTSQPDWVHCFGLVVCQSLVCHLDVVVVVIASLVVSLYEVQKVWVGCPGQTFWFICFHEFSLEDVPIC